MPDETNEPDPLLALIGAAVLNPNQWRREAARDVILRVLRAAVTQSETEAAYEESMRKVGTMLSGKERRAVEIAHDDTSAVGAALSKALRELEGGS